MESANKGQAELWDQLYPHQHESCQYNPLHLWLTGLIRRELAKLKFSTLLDVGCGDGTKLAMLRPDPAWSVTGLDISPVAIEMARESFPRGEFLVLDIQTAPPPGKYETIICSEVLEHVEADVAALQNIRAACDGTLVLTVPSGPRDATLRRWGHVRHYAKEELASKLTSAGWDIVKLRCLGFPFHTLYRLGLNLIPDSSVSQLGAPDVGRARRALFLGCYQLFKLNLSGLGWQLLAVARPAKSLK